MSKKITIQLNNDSIRKAIEEIEQYKESIAYKCTVLVDELIKVGITTAKENSGGYGKYILFEKSLGQDGYKAVGAIYASDAEKVIRKWYKKGKLKEAEVSPLLMAEFGSGWLAEVLDDVPGVGQGTFPEQTHAFDPQGWYWVGEDKTKQYSRGEKPTHPMHSAEIEMRDQIISIARRVFTDA